MNMPTQNHRWGLLPDEVMQLIKRREWDNMTALKSRLIGERAFPICIGLKIPNGRSALSDMEHFLRFMAAWKAFPHQEMIQWESKNLRHFSTQTMPTFLVVQSIKQLIQLLGGGAHARHQLWEKNMTPLLNLRAGGRCDPLWYSSLVKWLEVIEQLSEEESQLLAKLLPQLKPSLGQGCYLRALPLKGIDTKFLEKHQALIEGLSDVLHHGEITAAGGLLVWLDCHINPADWLTIRPLCETTRKLLGNLPILKIPSEIFKAYELPAKNIIVVENLQSGLALPDMDDTIAVIGAGKNVAWLDAQWLHHKRVGYWGDVDTWGLLILSEARRRFSQVEPLMMDVETLKAHEDRMVIDPNPQMTLPSYLHEKEIILFNDLVAKKFKSNRLEQERLSSDYVHQKIQDWLFQNRHQEEDEHGC